MKLRRVAKHIASVFGNMEELHFVLEHLPSYLQQFEGPHVQDIETLVFLWPQTNGHTHTQGTARSSD